MMNRETWNVKREISERSKVKAERNVIENAISNDMAFFISLFIPENQDKILMIKCGNPMITPIP